MNVAKLREALEVFDKRFEPQTYGEWATAIPILAEAARTIALPILEADPELVERLATVIAEWEPDYAEHQARKILAAISTPTPVEEL